MKQQDKSVFDEYKNYLEEKDIDIGKNTEEKALQFESEEMVLEEFKNTDWSFAGDDTTYLSHDIHPYPAKFPPQLPAQIIKMLSSSGEKVWDPFGGEWHNRIRSVIK